jgi:hypothetical protein
VNDYGDKKKFTSVWGRVTTPWSALKEIGRASMFIGTREIPFWVSLLIVLEVFLLVDVVWALASFRDYLYVPIWAHVATIMLLVSGILKKERLKAFWARAGFVPRHLRSLIENRSRNPANNVWVRLVAIVLLATGIANINLWLNFLAPFNAEELGVKLHLNPITAYLDLWSRVFAVSNLNSIWLNTFGPAMVVLLASSVLPVLRWFAKKTLIIHIFSFTVWGLLAISNGLWWERIYNIKW